MQPAALLENPTEAAEAAVAKFQKQHPRVNRYVGLLDAMQAAKAKGLSFLAVSKLGPVDYFAGVERDLAQLCVGRR